MESCAHFLRSVKQIISLRSRSYITGNPMVSSASTPRQKHMKYHYTDVIITMLASQITSLTVVYSTVHSDADERKQRKHQSSASLAFVWGIHRDRWIPRTKDQWRGKSFHLMTSSCQSITLPILCNGVHRWSVDFPHKWSVMEKTSPK